MKGTNPTQMQIRGWYATEKENFGLYICNISISVEQIEMRDPKIILKPQRALMLLCGCHDFTFISYIFLQSPSLPLKSKL